MTFDPSLDACLVQCVHLAQHAGRTLYGDPQFNAPRPVRAWVVEQRRISVNAAGEEVPTAHTVVLNDPVTIHDRLWLPGEDPTDVELARKPVDAKKMYDEDGTISHYEVVL